MARVGENRAGELEFCLCERFGIAAQNLDVGSRIVVGVEPVRIGGLEARDRARHTGVGCPELDPERGIAAAFVEVLDRGALALACDESLEFAGRQLLELVRNRLIRARERYRADILDGR